jgi:hypothetical protein
MTFITTNRPAFRSTRITVPAHWADADIKDIEREIVGLVIEAAKLDEDSTVAVSGIRCHGVYRQTWATLRRSGFIRRSGYAIDVRYY